MTVSNVVDGHIYKVSSPQNILVQVISGTPVFEYSLDDFATQSAVDLTASPSYPSAKVSLPACSYRLNLSGAVVKITGIL